MSAHKGNWLTAMKEVLRSPSPARSSFEQSSPAPSQAHRQSVDSFLAGLGPAGPLADNNPFKLQERSSTPEPQWRHVRGSPRLDGKGERLQPVDRLKLQQSSPLMRPKPLLRTQQDPNRHARAVAAASAAAAEAAAAAAQAAAEIMRLTYAQGSDLDKEFMDITMMQERAATLIQAAFRGHLARQALRALKALVKLQAVIRGHLVRRQARISLKCMQALVRLQTRVRARQVKTILEKETVKQEADKIQQMKAKETYLKQQKKLQEMAAKQRLIQATEQQSNLRNNARSLKTALGEGNSPLHSGRSNKTNSISNFQHLRLLDTSSHSSSMRSSDDMRDWDSTLFSKEENEARALKKQHAAAMRQRAMAYAETRQRGTRPGGSSSRRASHDYHHHHHHQQQQQRVSRLSFNETEPDKLHRDWSWLEGWMAAQGPALWEYNNNAHSGLAGPWDGKDEYDNGNLSHRHNHDHNQNCSHNRIAYSSDDDAPSVKIIEMDRIGTPPLPSSHPPVLSPASRGSGYANTSPSLCLSNSRYDLLPPNRFQSLSDQSPHSSLLHGSGNPEFYS